MSVANTAILMTPGAWGGLMMLGGCFAFACLVLGRLAYIVFSALRSVRPEVCDECGHEKHRGVCEHERGDQEVDGCLVAMGPCGCKGERR